jgi:ring-1,2-phenylacetyl-CoA epoxidase subunit PaaC
MRQFLFSQYQYLLYEQMRLSSDERLAGIASKALKETTYHVRWSSEWVIRLGDGTPESHARINHSLANLWAYTGEFFKPDEADLAMAEQGIAPSPLSLKEAWSDAVRAVLEEATLAFPEGVWQHGDGKTGYHTEHLGYILAEMQYLQRAYPGSEW